MLQHVTQLVFTVDIATFFHSVSLVQASMLTEPGGPFIDVSKLNLSKYAQKPALAKVLRRYLTWSFGKVPTDSKCCHVCLIMAARI